MKSITILAASITLTAAILCVQNMTERALAGHDGEISKENDAIEMIAKNIHDKSGLLKGKKIAVLYFSNLDGKETNDGKRLSGRLMECLIGKGGLTFIERAELDKLLKLKGVEQTGVVDTAGFNDTGGVLPIDVMITGTIAQVTNHGELTVKAVNATTGEIYIVTTASFYPNEPFSYKENPDKLELYAKLPDKLEIMNKTFNALIWLSNNKPVVFLLAVTDKNEPKWREHPGIAKKLKQVADRTRKERPVQWERLMRFRNGVKLLKEHDKMRYEEIDQKKNMIIKKLIEKI